MPLIAEVFGPRAVTSTGAMNRKYMSSLVFNDKADYDKLGLLDELEIKDARNQVMAAKEGKPVIVTNKTQGYDFATTLSISDRQCGMLLAGGLLNFTREQHS